MSPVAMLRLLGVNVMLEFAVTVCVAPDASTGSNRPGNTVDHCPIERLRLRAGGTTAPIVFSFACMVHLVCGNPFPGRIRSSRERSGRPLPGATCGCRYPFGRSWFI